ncbi:MAG: phosphoglycolate phosphatase [Alphaproteobacteria bacterium]|nr:phosphoglycolate phosphatase [Alphaproteobacteria bacterium]
MAALTVVFDLDGTLVDTAPDLIEALNVVFAREGLPPVDYATARGMIGGGARRMIESALQYEGRSASGSEVDRLLADFIAHYASHIADRSRAFPGLDTALDGLAARGCRFAVCTNKLEALSRLLLDTLGLTRRFAAICGQDTFGVQKPDPEILRQTIRAASGEIQRAVMVGDSGTDIATARAAGVPIVAVEFGYSAPPVKDLRPDRLIGHFDHLADAVLELASPLP